MKPETQQWIEYAEQDYQSACILLQSHLYNPCLYHSQQAIEKWLKSIILEHDLAFRRTHSIQGLVNILSENGMIADIADDEIDMIDSIFMPARYPVGSALPFFEPDYSICDQCLRIVERIKNWANSHLQQSQQAIVEEVKIPVEKEIPENLNTVIEE